MKIKKNDNVIIITGKDKGKSGKVVRALPKLDKVIVEGLNMTKRHQRSRLRGKKGEMVDVAMPIDVSNVKLADGSVKKPKAEKKTKTAKADKKDK